MALAQEMFNSLDANDNLELSKDELKQVLLLGLGEENHINIDVFDEMMRVMDVDGNGKVSF